MQRLVLILVEFLSKITISKVLLFAIIGRVTSGYYLRLAIRSEKLPKHGAIVYRLGQQLFKL